MNPLACPCPVLLGCVWVDAACQAPAAALGADESRATSPSTRSGGGPGDQGHLAPSPAALPCCSTGFSSLCISAPGLDLSRSSSLFATLISLHPSGTRWPIRPVASRARINTQQTLNKVTRGQWELPACCSRSRLGGGWLSPCGNPMGWSAGTGSRANGGLKGDI